MILQMVVTKLAVGYWAVVHGLP